MKKKGFVYVPTNCKEKKECKLHVHFHGCQQYYDSLGDVYVKHSGFNGYAESNDIIVLYPQTTSTFFPSNPQGCYDWYK
jgi:poly(3-hydroxybutyrate) depolymerase